MMDETSSPDADGQPDLWLVDRLLDPASRAEVLDGSDVDRERVRMERVRMAAIIDALRQPATTAELADEPSYLTAFDQASTQGKPVRTIVVGGRAAIVAGLAVLAAATGAAAYTGSLPGPLQRAAHSIVGAPADDQGSDQSGDDASEDPTETATQTATETPTEMPTGSQSSAVGPVATGPAAFGLCTAWTKGGLATTSVAYRNLAVAAGGADRIAAYCATIVKPGSTASHGSPTSHPHGSPTSHPSHTSHSTGSPTSHPGHTSHPTGSPTSHARH